MTSGQRFVRKLFALSMILGGTIAAGALWRCGDPLAANPSDCETGLARTDRCRIRDNSFQECRYVFEAIGVPSKKMCAALTQATADGPPQGVDDCDYQNPAHWKGVACPLARYPGQECYECRTSRLERAVEVVAFVAPGCDAATIIGTCNWPISEAMTELQRH